MKIVKGIGFSIPSENDDYIALDSFSSLADTDIAIFNADLSLTSYSNYDNSNSNSGEYEGKKLYNKESSVSIKEHSKHWKNELLHFVENGGTLFVILNTKKDFYVYSGTKTISGTGRSQKSTYHVSPFSNYDFLPFDKIEYNVAIGKTIIPQLDIVKDFYKHFKELLSFEVYLKSEHISKGIFSTKKNDRILGANLKVKNGHLVFLPNISFGDEKYSNYDEENNTEKWNDEGKRLGKILVSCIVEIDKTLKSEKQITPKPNWLENSKFDLKESQNTKKQILKITTDIEEHKKQLVNLESVLGEQENLKDLLFETGTPLELAVIKALHIMGYKAENYDDGQLELDQIILSPEGDRFIGECEGKDNKDIDVTKFRQLLDGLNADFEKENVTEKAFGLLFGNPQRLINPSDRNLDFTLKCKSGAKREKIGLIKTTDLFDVCKIITENNDLEYAKKCRLSVIEQMGNLIKFPEYTK
jgi:hypothetical protein